MIPFDDNIDPIIQEQAINGELNENLNNGEFFDFMDIDYALMEDNQNSISESKLKVRILENKAFFSCMRLAALYFFYFLENYTLTLFLAELIMYLLVYEAILIANCLVMKVYLLLTQCIDPTNSQFPLIFMIIDKINTFLFFLWFVYGLGQLMLEAEGVGESLDKNPLTTYYITFLILFGIVIFAKYIVIIFFFICFCPCIAYSFGKEMYNEYQEAMRAKRVLSELVEEKYEDYRNIIEKNEEGGVTCAICTDDFKPKEKIIKLRCNSLHVFHSECIREWIKKKAICPICRFDLAGQEN